MNSLERAALIGEMKIQKAFFVPALTIKEKEYQEERDQNLLGERRKFFDSRFDSSPTIPSHFSYSSLTDPDNKEIKEIKKN